MLQKLRYYFYNSTVQSNFQCNIFFSVEIIYVLLAVRLMIAAIWCYCTFHQPISADCTSFLHYSPSSGSLHVSHTPFAFLSTKKICCGEAFYAGLNFINEMVGF